MMQSDVRAAWKATIPVIFGYIPLGIAFGLLFAKSGGAWYLAPLMSLFVFAGAAQFVAIIVLANHGSLTALALSTFLINLRHIFYGIPFVGHFPDGLFKKNYMIFALTDESFSILSTQGPENSSDNFKILVMCISHFYWVFGSFLGAYFSSYIKYDVSFLKFSLTALFVVLTVEQAYKVKQFYPFILSTIASIIALLWFKEQMLLIAMITYALGLTLCYKAKN